MKNDIFEVQTLCEKCDNFFRYYFYDRAIISKLHFNNFPVFRNNFATEEKPFAGCHARTTKK